MCIKPYYEIETWHQSTYGASGHCFIKVFHFSDSFAVSPLSDQVKLTVPVAITVPVPCEHDVVFLKLLPTVVLS